MLIFLLFIIEFIVFIPVSKFSTDLTPLLFISINFLLTSYALKFKVKTQFFHIIFAAYICRILLIIANSYTGFLEYISPDSVVFQRVALASLNNGGGEISNNYANFLSVIYSFVGPYKIIGQYVNVLFGLGSIIGMTYILNEFNLSRKSGIIVMCIICFSPFSLIYDSSLLREAWVRFFIVWSIFYFIRWYKYGNIKNAIISIVCVLVSSYMHGGSLFICIGYLIAFSTYNVKSQKAVFSLKSIIVLAIIIAGSVLLFSLTDVFTNKVDRIMQADSLENAISNFIRDSGRSAYLTWINPQNTSQILLYSPLKMFYFLFSPMPMNWQNAIDLVAFFTDSLVYFLLLWFIFKKNKLYRSCKTRLKYLTISLFFIVFVFAFGTWNSGTAIRHRTKILPLILTMYLVVRSEKEKMRTKIL